MSARNAVREAVKVSVFRVVPPQDGGWSLMPMENLLRGLRNINDMFSLELYGVDGAISYGVRTTRPHSMNGMFSAYFPQADVSTHQMGEVPGEDGESDRGDWMHLEEEELAIVQTLGLQRESYLPLRVFDDSAIRQAEMDPLAGLIGVVSSNSSLSTSSGSDRMGIRLLLRPAPEDWSAPWQKRMQARRDGEDRESRSTPAAKPDSGPGAGVILALAGLIGFAGINWFFYNSGNIAGMVLFNGACIAAGGAGIGLWRRFFAGARRRPYLDETLVEEKLKSLSFQTELQIVRTYRRGDDYGLALDSIEQVINCIRSFDDPAGNSWQPGRLFRYVGESVARRDYVGKAASSGDSSGGDSSGGSLRRGSLRRRFLPWPYLQLAGDEGLRCPPVRGREPHHGLA